MKLAPFGNSDLEMGNNYIFPMHLQILKREPAMAMLCGRLTAQQDGSLLEALFREDGFDFSGAD
jgi:hypothetical protein